MSVVYFPNQSNQNVQPVQTNFLDSKLNEIRLNVGQYPSSDLVLYADYNFNLRNDPKLYLKLSEGVRWQIYFASMAKKNPNGTIELGSINGGQFSIAHLNPHDLAMLYRIFNSYHQFYEIGKKGDEAIFSKHMEIIEARFKSSEQITNDSIQALEAQYDPNLRDIIRKLKEHQAQVNAAKAPPKPVLSFLDTKLEEVRGNWKNYQSGGLVVWADMHFNLKNSPNSALKLSEEVRWQIYFASMAKKNQAGSIDLGSFYGGGFSIAHLKVSDLAVLYRILHSYHFSYEKQMCGNNSIFSKHLELIEARFKSNSQMTQEATKALEALQDPKLLEIINRLKASQIQGGLINGFCQARIGAPNPSCRNCGYNSISVAYAHTGLADKALSLRSIKETEEIEMITKESEEQTVNCEKQIRDHEEEISQLIKKRDNLAKSQESLSFSYNLVKNKLEELKANTLRDYIAYMAAADADDENFDYDKIDISHINCFKWDRATTKKYGELQIFNCCESCKKENTDSSSYYIKLREVRQNLEEVESQINRIQPHLAYLKGQLESIKQRAQNRIENVKTSMKTLEENRLKALDTLKILRGEAKGQLTESDTRNLSDVANLFGINEMMGYRPYGHSPTNVSADAPHYPELRKALDDPNWRVIRVGGYGHWWAYVRNPDMKTVDTINDSLITKNSLTTDQLFAIYSNPEAWKQTQITFYSLSNDQLVAKN